MPIKSGSNNTVGFYLGSIKLSKIYLGNDLVWAAIKGKRIYLFAFDSKYGLDGSVWLPLYDRAFTKEGMYFRSWGVVLVNNDTWQNVCDATAYKNIEFNLKWSKYYNIKWSEVNNLQWYKLCNEYTWKTILDDTENSVIVNNNTKDIYYGVKENYVKVRNILYGCYWYLNNVSYSNGVYTFVDQSISSLAMMYCYPKEQPISSHVYYGRCYQKSSQDFTAADARNEWHGADIVNYVFSVMLNHSDWTLCSSLIKQQKADVEYMYRSFVVNGSTTSYRKEYLLIDLTEAFGEGNEPTKEWCDENIKYFDEQYAYIKVN